MIFDFFRNPAGAVKAINQNRDCALLPASFGVLEIYNLCP
jgi:hypothetical protein